MKEVTTRLSSSSQPVAYGYETPNSYILVPFLPLLHIAPSKTA